MKIMRCVLQIGLVGSLCGEVLLGMQEPPQLQQSSDFKSRFLLIFGMHDKTGIMPPANIRRRVYKNVIFRLGGEEKIDPFLDALLHADQWSTEDDKKTWLYVETIQKLLAEFASENKKQFGKAAQSILERFNVLSKELLEYEITIQIARQQEAVRRQKEAEARKQHFKETFEKEGWCWEEEVEYSEGDADWKKE